MGLPLKNRLAVFALLCSVQALLSACADLADKITQLSYSERKHEQLQNFEVIPAKDAWVSVPTTGVVLQRGLPGGFEQRLALVNSTTALGDNMLTLRTRSGDSANGRLRFEEFLERVGGLPHPFTDLRSGDLFAASDEMGEYFWAQKPYGSQSVCVIAFRRLTGAQRVIPNGADVMDVMLRNCIVGDPQEALLPIQPQSLALGPLSRGVNSQVRLLSPLAGPEF